MYIHDSAHHAQTKTIDVLGIAILAVGVSALQYFEHGQRDDWSTRR